MERNITRVFYLRANGYALGNLFTDFESFDPPSTPALEVRVVPLRNVYVKTMVGPKIAILLRIIRPDLFHSFAECL